MTASAHPGGYTMITAVVGGDRKIIADKAQRASEKPAEWEISIERKKKARSLDANAYYWQLITKLSGVLRTSKDELHEQMLQDYGVFREIGGAPVTFTLRADIDPHEVTPYTKVIRTGEIGGKPAVMYGVLKGSSEMDSREFSTLLDGLISECKEQGIETLTPLEIERLKAALKEEQNAH